jgi:hypothetical protein
MPDPIPTRDGVEMTRYTRPDGLDVVVCPRCNIHWVAEGDEGEGIEGTCNECGEELETTPTPAAPHPAPR